MGFVTYATTCQACSGAGRVLQNPCGICHGVAYTNKEHSINVNIPVGVDTGDTLRAPGQGTQVKKGKNGDLFVHVVVKPHARFKRVDGRHLMMHADVRIAMFVLGGSIDVTLLDGTKQGVVIPPRTLPGSTVIVSGMGCTKFGVTEKGDLRVVLGVDMPTEVSSEAETVLRQFDELT